VQGWLAAGANQGLGCFGLLNIQLLCVHDYNIGFTVVLNMVSDFLFLSSNRENECPS
jgi:hypothetical protein